MPIYSHWCRKFASELQKTLQDYISLFFSKGKQKLSVSFERQDMKNPIVCCNFATRIKPKRQGLKMRDNFESS